MSDLDEDSIGEDFYCDLPEVRHHPIYSEAAAADRASVASHYNSRPNVQPVHRGRSAIIHLRDFNNWTKSVLIREFVSKRNLKVLDLACGKGGDLFKWDKAKVSHLTGVGKSLIIRRNFTLTLFSLFSSIKTLPRFQLITQKKDLGK